MRVPLKASKLPGDGKLWDHQKQAIKLSVKHPRFALLMEQGTGKTAVALATIGVRNLRGEVHRVLIFTTKSTIYSWEYWTNRLLNVPMDVAVLDGSSAERVEKLNRLGRPSKLQVVITNYTSSVNLKDDLRHWMPDMVIVDESHHIKGYKGKQSKAIHYIAQASPYRMIMTGTPIIKNQLDVFGQYRFLDESIFGANYFKFRNRYALMGGYMKKQVKGILKEKELARKMHSIAFRVKLDDALDMPQVLPPTLIFGDLEPHASTIYEQMEKEAVAEILDQGIEVMAPIVLTKLLRLSQITGGFISTEDGSLAVSDAKQDLLAETLEDTLADITKKVVVFARFIPEVHAIEKIAEKYNPVTIFGAVSAQDRFDYIKAFQEDDHTRVLIAQVATGGEGIELFRADTVIFYSMDYSYGNYEQAKARLRRPGQKHPVNVIHLVIRNSIDEIVFQAVEAKRNVAQLIVDKLRARYGELR